MVVSSELSQRRKSQGAGRCALQTALINVDVARKKMLRTRRLAMRKGAVDFLEKPLDEEALVSAIIRGAELTRKRFAEHAQRIELESRLGALTPREREVFALITTGLLNKQVGAELGTTERTVKAHRERVMIKMKADS